MDKNFVPFSMLVLIIILFQPHATNNELSTPHASALAELAHELFSFIITSCLAHLFYVVKSNEFHQANTYGFVH